MLFEYAKYEMLFCLYLYFLLFLLMDLKHRNPLFFYCLFIILLFILYKDWNALSFILLHSHHARIEKKRMKFD